MSITSIQGNYGSTFRNTGYNNNGFTTNTIYPNSIYQPSDSVEISGKEKGFSKTQKCGIGLAAAAALAAAVLLMRGKAGAANKEIKALAEHIDFTPAKTAEEAINFASKKLGVYIIDEMPLDVLNYVNEGLCFLRNKSPKDFNIKLVGSKGISRSCDSGAIANAFAIQTKKGQTLFGINLSKDFIKDIDKTLMKSINHKIQGEALVDINGKLQYNKLHSKVDVSSEIAALANRFKQNPSSLTFKEKVKLDLGLCEIEDTLNKLCIEYNGDITKFKDSINAIINEFHPIIHEQGHILHCKKISQKDFDLLDQLEILKQKGLTTSKYDEFTDKYLHTAQKVSDYAKASPAEFVAEVYAKSLSGVKFDKDVLDLYARYGGPALA